MASLKTLQSIGYTTAFFELPEVGSTYYTFDNATISRQPGYWNIVGVNLHQENDFFLDLQILYIDEEALQYRPFSALRDASNFLSLHQDEMQALVSFLEEKFNLRDSHLKSELQHFSMMNEQELAELHFDEREIQQNCGNYYLYHPDSHIQTFDEISIIGLPSWDFKGKIYSTGTLVFATFDRERLKDPAFHILDGEWLGSIRFDLQALREFIFLLKQQAK
jgi:hypothetical protein